MLPKERMPSLPATLVTTVSISEPFPTTTKLVTTGGLPSVKSIVKVPVQSRVYRVRTLGRGVSEVGDSCTGDGYAVDLFKGTLAVKISHRNANLQAGRARYARDREFGALKCESVMTERSLLLHPSMSLSAYPEPTEPSVSSVSTAAFVNSFLFIIPPL